MKYLKITVFSCVLVAVLIGLLLRTGVTHAAPASSCGSWTVVASPNVGKHALNELRATAAISASDVWTVGYTGKSGILRPLTEHWNGTKWSIIPSLYVQQAGSALYGVAAVSTNDVWAVGSFSYVHGATSTLIEHWNGTEWSIIPSPNGSSSNSFLYGVAAVSSNDVWAVGETRNPTNHTLVEHWDGSQWSVVASPDSGNIDNALFAVAAVSANDIWAVGYTSFSSDLDEKTLIEHWNGTKWSLLSSPNIAGTGNFLNGVAAVSTNDVWAVGNTVNDQAVIIHWNGSTWSLIPSPKVNAGSALNAVAAVTASNVWAVGYRGSLYNGTLIEHWNGTQWIAVNSPNGGSNGNDLLGVTDVPGTTHVWTVGYSFTFNNPVQTLTEFHC